jgi:ABC-type tungstate transport system permease subunit
MMRQLSAPVAAAVLALALLGTAAARIHLRVQTTLVGYEIGHLKSDEAKLLEQRSGLKMQLAKLTTKKHLMLMTSTDERKTASEGTLALK